MDAENRIALFAAELKALEAKYGVSLTINYKHSNITLDGLLHTETQAIIGFTAAAVEKASE